MAPGLPLIRAVDSDPRRGGPSSGRLSDAAARAPVGPLIRAIAWGRCKGAGRAVILAVE